MFQLERLNICNHHTMESAHIWKSAIFAFHIDFIPRKIAIATCVGISTGFAAGRTDLA